MVRRGSLLAFYSTSFDIPERIRYNIIKGGKRNGKYQKQGINGLQEQTSLY